MWKIVRTTKRLFCDSRELSGKDSQPESWKAKSAFEERMKSIMWSFKDTNDRFRHQKWREVFEKQNPHDLLFSLPLSQEKTEWTVWLDKEAIWDRFSTLSDIAVLDSQERDVRDQLLFHTRL